MYNRKNFLSTLLFDFPDFAEELAAPDANIVSLNRISYGATEDSIESIKKKGLPVFIEEQLNPVDADDEAVTTRLSSLMLHIKYDESLDKYPAVDEDRPLVYLNATMEKLWPLGDYKTPMAGQERNRPVEEIRVASWVKAVYSKWQLREIMVEFWHNHFNVNAFSEAKVTTSFPIYDREVIRKNCFGNFRTFLEDVAKSTAMQYYLDNFSSKASPANENFARELFELHTLGSDHYFNNLYNRWREVPGALTGKPIGYIDEDVYEAARSFTGWTIADGSGLGKGENLPNTGEFYYYDGWHDNYQKRVLGVEFDPNQPPLQDGLKVLDLVAYHPATAKHLCQKLCKRFISDNPSATIVNGAVAVWVKHQKSPDQIKHVLRFILLSKELQSSWGQKVKRPFELVASLLRATSADFTPNGSLTGQLSQMGYFHYQWPTPTGHPDKSEYWLSSNTMLARWNTAINFVVNRQNKLTNYSFRSLTPIEIKTPTQVAEYWTRRVLQKNKSTEFLSSMTTYVANGKKTDDPIPDNQFEARVSNLVALLSMTPDFQLK
jgi:uncharacterized protein (DUF1800 family)